MRYCKYCGAKTDIDSKFCIACGKELPPTNDSSINECKGTRVITKKAVLVISLVVVLSVILGVVIYSIALRGKISLKDSSGDTVASYLETSQASADSTEYIDLISKGLINGVEFGVDSNITDVIGKYGKPDKKGIYEEYDQKFRWIYYEEYRDNEAKCVTYYYDENTGNVVMLEIYYPGYFVYGIRLADSYDTDVMSILGETTESSFDADVLDTRITSPSEYEEEVKRLLYVTENYTASFHKRNDNKIGSVRIYKNSVNNIIKSSIEAEKQETAQRIKLAHQDAGQYMDLLSKGLVNGIEFGIGSNIKDIKAKLGNPDDEGYNETETLSNPLRGQYITYYSTNMSFYYDETTGTVSRIILYDKNDSYGFKIGDTYDDMVKVFGEPDLADPAYYELSGSPVFNKYSYYAGNYELDFYFYSGLQSSYLASISQKTEPPVSDNAKSSYSVPETENTLQSGEIQPEEHSTQKSSRQEEFETQGSTSSAETETNCDEQKTATYKLYDDKVYVNLKPSSPDQIAVIQLDLGIVYYKSIPGISDVEAKLVENSDLLKEKVSTYFLGLTIDDVSKTETIDKAKIDLAKEFNELLSQNSTQVVKNIQFSIWIYQ